MSTNQIQKGDIIDLVAGGTITSGQGVVSNQLFGVALKGAASGETYPVAVTGVFELARDSADTFAVGTQVFWEVGGPFVTTTATSNKPIGYAVEAKSPGSGTIKVRLSGNDRVAAST